MISLKLLFFQSLSFLFLFSRPSRCEFIKLATNKECPHPGSQDGNSLPPLFQAASEDSEYVADYPDGHVSELTRMIHHYEYVAVMMYAPWSSYSARGARVFASVARGINTDPITSGRMQFVAVNCWCVTGQCRQLLLSQTFPALFVYRRGDLTKPAKFLGHLSPSSWPLTLFLRIVLKPVTLIKDTSMLKHTLALHENVVLGHAPSEQISTDNTGGGDGADQHAAAYKVLREAAWTALLQGSQPLYDVQYGVTSSPTVARFLNLTSVPPSVTLLTAIGERKELTGRIRRADIEHLAAGAPPSVRLESYRC
eukprot:scpid90678/ scgid4743/ Thioredoxin domain-containing protein 11